jgi:anti-anti-sigma factor
MKYAIEKSGESAFITLQEDKLDTRVAPDLKSEFVYLFNEGIRFAALDIHQATFADSSGIGALLMANRLANQNDGAFFVVGVQEPVQKLLEVSRVDSVLRLKSTLDEARAEITHMLAV